MKFYNAFLLCSSYIATTMLSRFANGQDFMYTDEEVIDLCGGFSIVPCWGGCWNPNGTQTMEMLEQGEEVSGHTRTETVRWCEPVGAGYYSPVNDDDRYPTPPGTFVDSDSAYFYKLCPVGTFSADEASTECTGCLPGTYNDERGMDQCQPCDPSLYEGSKSDRALPLRGTLFCLPPKAHLTPPPTDTPSFVPSMAPTVTAVPSSDPSLAPSTAPSMLPSLLPTETLPSALPTELPSTFPSTSSPTEPEEPPTQEQDKYATGLEGKNDDDSSKSKKSFEGLKTWQYILILGACFIFALLGKRFYNQRKQQQELASRPTPPPPSSNVGSEESSDSDDNAEQGGETA